MVREKMSSRNFSLTQTKIDILKKSQGNLKLFSIADLIPWGLDETFGVNMISLICFLNCNNEETFIKNLWVLMKGQLQIRPEAMARSGILYLLGQVNLIVIWENSEKVR